MTGSSAAAAAANEAPIDATTPMQETGDQVQLPENNTSREEALNKETAASSSPGATLAAAAPSQSPPPTSPLLSLMEQATKLKNQGNSHFSSQQYKEAAQSYSMALDITQNQQKQQQQQPAAVTENGASPATTEWTTLEVALRSNLAIVLLRMDNFQEAEMECTKALKLDSSNAKAWYRRALAREGLSQQKNNSSSLKAAVVDLETCLSLFPDTATENAVQQKMMEAARDAITRMERRLINVDQSSADKPTAETTAETTAKPQQKENGDVKHKDTAANTTTAASAIPSPHEQRQDVIRLLLARRQAFSKQQQQVVDGEAYFLLNWSWWCAWCQHTDFFYLQQQSSPKASTATQNTAKIGKRQRQVLQLLPPGTSIAVVQQHNKNASKKQRRSVSCEDDDSSSSSEDEDEQETAAGDHSSGFPDVIDNSCLLLDDTTCPQRVFYRQWNPHLQQQEEQKHEECCVLLRPNLVRGYDYELLPREVYFALRVWYGEVTPSICRRASIVDEKGAAVILKLYPEHFGGKAAPPKGPQCGACRSPGAKCRCKRCLTVHYCDRSCQESHWISHKFACKKLAASRQEKEGHVVLPENSDRWGRVGLNNLGNTCFMNSAIQCLSHATPLTRHFLSNRFKADLNSDNPLGTGGKLAFAYESVLKDIWMLSTTTNSTSTSPTALKRAIAVFAPRFAGCSQHDAQEFLAYLLDGLHEDLNRIRKPPYVEMPTVKEGQNMAVAGAEAWDAHQRRNDSLVLDTFYGQFKSTCVCPKCDRVSVSFDAFNHVSLEIPQFHNTPRTIPILVVRSFAAKATPTRYGITIRRNEFVVDLRRALSEQCGIPTTRLVICDVYEHAIYEILPDGKPVSSIRSNDFLAAYEVDPYTNVTIHAICKNVLAKKKNNISGLEAAAAMQEEDDDDDIDLFGFPFMTSFDAQLTCREIWNHIWKQVRSIMVGGELAENGWGGEGDNNKEYEERLQSMLQIRIVDNSGNPRPVFLDEDLTNIETTNGVDIASVIPPTCDEKMIKYLGKDCTERFLFLHLEWNEQAFLGSSNNETGAVTPPLLPMDRFLSYMDHPSFHQALEKQRSMKNGIKGGVTIEQCFETFTRPERLDEHNKWYCSKCKEHVRAMKTMELWRLPNVLVVHLKRFEFKHALRRDKLDTLVDFPLDGLDMSKHCASSSSTDPECNGEGDASDNTNIPSTFCVDDGVPAMYDLFAVTNHYGRLGFGHYTAFARRWDEQGMTKDWALFDDSTVTSVGDGSGRDGTPGVVTPAAYVLFYRRRIFN